MPLEIVVQDQKLKSLLVNMVNTTEDLSEPLEGIAQDIQNHIDLEFAGSTDPYGVKWVDLKSPRKKRKGKQRTGSSDKVLTDTGVLAASFTAEGKEGSIFEIGDDFVRIGSDLEYAATHNFGDAKRGIPQRQIVPDKGNIPAELMEVMLERVQNHFGFN